MTPFPILVILSTLFALSQSAETSLGCYANLPSSYTTSSTYEYQTPSYCYGICGSEYSYFALYQGNTCICGNEAPSGDTSSDCTTSCFGYGSKTCGGSDAYNFYSTGKDSTANSKSNSNSGSTSTTSTSTSSTSSTSGTTNNSNTKTESTTNTGSTTTSTSQTSSSETSEAGNTSTTTSAVSTQSVSGTTVVIYSTVAVNPTTVSTVVTTASSSTSSKSTENPSSSANASSKDSSNSKKSNIVGPVVGGVVGGVVFIILIVLLIIFLRRRSNNDTEEAVLSDSAYQAAIKRDKSQINRPLSNPFLSKEETMIDQRLNPVMLGRRRISEGSLADEADYSRKILRVANPDDEL